MLVGLRLVEGRRLRGRGRHRGGKVARGLGRSRIRRGRVGGCSEGRLVRCRRWRIGRESLSLCRGDAAAHVWRHAGRRLLVRGRREGALLLMGVHVQILRLHGRRLLAMRRVLGVVGVGHGGRLFPRGECSGAAGLSAWHPASGPPGSGERVAEWEIQAVAMGGMGRRVVICDVSVERSKSKLHARTDTPWLGRRAKQRGSRDGTTHSHLPCSTSRSHLPRVALDGRRRAVSLRLCNTHRVWPDSSPRGHGDEEEGRCHGAGR